MTREQIEQDLINSLDYLTSNNGRMFKGSLQKVSSKLKTEIEFDIFHVEGLSYGLLRDALTRIGEVVEDREAKSEIIARVGAGFADLNIALLVISITGEFISVASYAKEGLINQHTAKKAINNLKNSLTGKYLNNQLKKWDSHFLCGCPIFYIVEEQLLISFITLY